LIPDWTYFHCPGITLDIGDLASGHKIKFPLSWRHPSPNRMSHPRSQCQGHPPPEHFGEGPRACLHHAVEMRVSPISGRGLFARSLIRAGEVVWAERSDPRDERLLSWAQVEALPDKERAAFLNFAYQVGPDLFSGPSDEEALLRDHSHFQNHSCAPRPALSASPAHGRANCNRTTDHQWHAAVTPPPGSRGMA